MPGISHTPPGTHKKGLPMLQLKKIRKEYKTGDLVQTALNDVSLNLRDSEFVAILGPSGSGKTTLLNIIGGLDRYDSGDLVINGISTKKYTDRDWDSYRNHTIGFVFQSYNLMPQYTAVENVELPLMLRGMGQKERRKQALAVMEQVGIVSHAEHKPSELSGGQQQRVGIARALITKPPIIFADELTGNLDTKTSAEIMDLLTGLFRESGTTFMLVSHDPDMSQYTDRTIHLLDGKIISEETNQSVRR